MLSCSKEGEDDYNSADECDGSIAINNTNEIEGYSDKISYNVGDSVSLKIHSLTPLINVDVYHYGENSILVHTANNIAANQQNYNCRSYSYGCDWQTTYTFFLSTNLKPGIYAAHITNGLSESDYISFVVKNPNLANNDVLVLAATNTWQAYNQWSNQSFYNYGLSEQITSSTIVSFMRPNTADSPLGNTGHLVNAELHLHRWLEYMGYGFDVIADIDLHEDANILNNYKVLILNVHPEYWTLAMYKHLIEYLENGGNLMYLGGNGVYWRVALAFDRIEVKKTGGYHGYDLGIGGKWREIGRPESQYLGVEYTRPGINTYAAYSIVQSNHWVFNGTTLNNGDLIGENCLNGGKASGHETDKMSNYSPSNCILLAKGLNPNGSGAEMVYYQNVSNNSKVFSVGSITYTGSLAVDTNISRITKNVLDNFIQ